MNSVGKSFVRTACFVGDKNKKVDKLFLYDSPFSIPSETKQEANMHLKNNLVFRSLMFNDNVNNWRKYNCQTKFLIFRSMNEYIFIIFLSNRFKFFFFKTLVELATITFQSHCIGRDRWQLLLFWILHINCHWILANPRALFLEQNDSFRWHCSPKIIQRLNNRNLEW